MAASLIWLVVVVLVFLILIWGVYQITMPDPLRVGIIVLLSVVALVVLGKVLITLVGSPAGF